MFGGNAHPPPAYGVGHGVHRVVLAHDVLPQAVVQPGKPLKLLLLNGGGGNFRPQLDHPGQMGGGQRGVALGGQLIPLHGQLGLTAFQLRQPLVRLIVGGGLHRLLLLRD